MNLARNKYAVVFYSVGGNTKQLAKLIELELTYLGCECDFITLDKSSIDVSKYKHVFLGSPTYGEGKTPSSMIAFLRYVLKENDFELPAFSVFGTGDTQWTTYCRAVDEMKYHLSKKSEVINELKLEQYPINKQQLEDIRQYVREVIACYN